MTRASDGTSSVSVFPTATMRSPSMSTVVFGCCAPVRTSINVPPPSAITSVMRRSVEQSGQDFAYDTLELAELVPASHAQRHLVETHLLVHAQVLDALVGR